MHSSAAAPAAVNCQKQATRQHFTAANNVALKLRVGRRRGAGGVAKDVVVGEVV